MPENVARNIRPVIVARCLRGNHNAANLVKAFNSSGWAAANPIVKSSVNVKFDVYRPRSRPKTPSKIAPRPTDLRKPYVSMAHAAGIASGM